MQYLSLQLLDKQPLSHGLSSKQISKNKATYCSSITSTTFEHILHKNACPRNIPKINRSKNVLFAKPGERWKLLRKMACK